MLRCELARIYICDLIMTDKILTFAVSVASDFRCGLVIPKK